LPVSPYLLNLKDLAQDIPLPESSPIDDDALPLLSPDLLLEETKIMFNDLSLSNNRSVSTRCQLLTLCGEDLFMEPQTIASDLNLNLLTNVPAISADGKTEADPESILVDV